MQVGIKEQFLSIEEWKNMNICILEWISWGMCPWSYLWRLLKSMSWLYMCFHILWSWLVYGFGCFPQLSDTVIALFKVVIFLCLHWCLSWIWFHFMSITISYPWTVLLFKSTLLWLMIIFTLLLDVILCFINCITG